jgi:hypothetical protein
LVNNQIKPLNRLIRRFYSDGAPEYRAINTKKCGIVYTTTGSYAPQQNPAVERVNLTISIKMRSLLYQAKLPRRYWGEALEMAVYLYNRTPYKSLGLKTPFEAKTGQKPDISHLKIFGSLAYWIVDKPKKLDPRGRPYYLVRYVAPNIFRLLKPKEGKITISRDVKVHEGSYYKHVKEIISEYPDLEDLTPEKGVEDQDQDPSLDLNEDQDLGRPPESDLAKQVQRILSGD